MWEVIELVGVIYFTKDMDRQILSMSINEVFSELILDILKQVGEDVVVLGFVVRHAGLRRALVQLCVVF